MSDGQALHDREGQAFTRDLRPRRQRVKRIGRQPDLVKDVSVWSSWSTHPPSLHFRCIALRARPAAHPSASVDE